MPVYVYRNLRTGETFEVEQRIAEPALTEHPESGDPVKRLVQPVGIAFKGSGFYVTDSRKSSSASAKPSKSDSTEGKTESKPEAASTSEVKAETGTKAEKTKSTASSTASSDGGAKSKS
jgi:putative FmdB family regulatory protein